MATEQESDDSPSATSSAATKVQEAAANMKASAAKQRGRITGSKAEAVTRRYFEAIGAYDVQGAAAMWAPDGREDVRGQGLYIGPEGLREFIGGLIEAIPDLKVEIVSTTTEDERCALHWQLQRHVRGAGLVQRARADRPSHRAGRRGRADCARWTDPLQRSFPRHDGGAAPDRDAAAGGLLGRTAGDGRVQRQDARQRRADGRRGKARGRGRMGGTGSAGPVQRVPDRGRGRGRRDCVRRGRAHDDARGGEGRGASSAGSSGSCWAMGTPTTAGPRPGWARPCGVIPRRSKTPRAAADGATGRPTWQDCRRWPSRFRKRVIVTPGTTAR